MNRLSKEGQPALQMLWRRLPVAIVYLAAASVTLYLASLGMPIVLANDCIAASQQQAYEAAAVVFRGRVLKIEDTAATVDPVDRDTGKLALQPVSGFKIVTVTVSKIWKGPSSSEIQLFVFENPSMGTGFQFRVGSEYVIDAIADVAQDWSEIRRFSQQSRIYGIGVGCTLRVRVDVDTEARSLDARARKDLKNRAGSITK